MKRVYPVPPPELIYDWAKDRALLQDPTPLPEYIANRAAQWGADQERLIAARRSKPPSMADQSTKELDDLQAEITRMTISSARIAAIRDAVKRLVELKASKG